MKKRSSVLTLRQNFASIKRIFDIFSKDNVTLYAAQASFFAVISAIPLLMLLLSIARIFFSDVIDDLFRQIPDFAPEVVSNFISAIYGELTERSNVPILPISALLMFWTSSRGVAAIFRGVCSVYGTRERTNFITETIRSFFYTVTFILSVLCILLLIVFGESIRLAVVSRFPSVSRIYDLIDSVRVIFIFALFTALFTAIYSAVSRNGVKKGADKSQIPVGIRSQTLGAVVASFGWILYSYFYSLYITNFPNASYIYGSLTAVILLMLWLYFCMIIFLVGAEINKAVFVRKKK